MVERFKEKNPLFETLRKHNRPPEVQAKSMIQGYIMADWLLFTSVQKKAGIQKAMELHDKAWTKLAAELFLDGQSTLKIGKVEDLATLSKMTRFMYDLRSMPIQTEKEDKDFFIGVIPICAFVHYSSELFDEKLGSDYWKSLSQVEKNQLEHLIDKAQLKGVEARWEKQMCAGDDCCRIVLKRIE